MWVFNSCICMYLIHLSVCIKFMYLYVFNSCTWKLNGKSNHRVSCKPSWYNVAWVYSNSTIHMYLFEIIWSLYPQCISYHSLICFILSLICFILSLILGSKYTPPRKIPHPRFSVATLIRFVACFTRVKTEDSNRNRLASTAYFAKPGTFREGNILVT